MADLIRWARDRKKELEDIASRSWDQLNPLDGGRTWEQRTPTKTGSAIDQAYNSGASNVLVKPRINNAQGTANGIKANVLNVASAIDTGFDAINNSDLGYRNIRDSLNANKDAIENINKANTSIDNSNAALKEMAKRDDIVGTRAKLALLKGDFAKTSNPYVDVGDFKGSGLIEDFATSPFKQLAGLTNIAEGNYKKGAGQFVTGTIEGPAGLIPIGKTAQVGTRGSGLLPKIAASATQGAKEGAVYGAAYGGGASAAQDASFEDILKNAVIGGTVGTAGGAFGGAAFPVVGAGFRKGGTALAEREPLVPNMVGSIGNNLEDALNMDRYKNPIDPNAPKPTDPLVELNKKNAQVEKQLVDSGVTPAYAKKVVSENDNSFIALNLLGGDKLKNARNADAYVKSVIKAKTGPTRQQTQDMLNGVSNKDLPEGYRYASKEEIQDNFDMYDQEVMDSYIRDKDAFIVSGKGDDLTLHTPDEVPVPKRPMGKSEDRPANVDPATGEVIEPPKPAAKNVDEFVTTLPDAKVTTRADADKLIGEGTDWLRKAGNVIDERLKLDGDSFDNFARAIHQASDDVKAGKTPKVSPLYQEIYDTIKPALDKFRKASGKETGETPYYLPRRPINGGEQIQMGNTLVDSLDAATFGSAEKRTGALGIDDTDLTPDSLGSYATQTLGERYRHSMAVDDLMKAAEKRGKPITQKQASKAVTLQDKLAKGFTKAAKDGSEMRNDTIGDLNKLGEAEGIELTDNAYKPGRLLQSPEHMLKGARVWERGFKQYDYSIANANTFIGMLKKNKVPNAQFGAALRKSLVSQMPNADKEIIDKAVANAVRRMEKDGVAPKDAAGLVNMAIRSVAKEEMVKLGKSTAFLDGKMSQVVSEQINGRVLNSLHETNFLQGVDSFITERVNVALRGLNITSAFFELGDIANIFSNYGLKNLKQTQAGIGPIKGDTLYFSHKYGQANASFLTPDMPEVKALKKIWDNPNTSLTKKMYESYRTGENKLLIFRYIEQHKTELFFRTADKYHKQQGLRGNDLVTAVMDDYKTTMLPHTLGTANRLLGKMPKALTQYMNWGLQATKRLGRTVSGSNKAGIYKDMSRPSRIGVGVATELVPKATAAAVIGVPLMQILGMRDFTGATSADFTGIDDEDKNKVDKAAQLLSLSPVLGTGANIYFANRRNQIADAKKAAGEDYKSERSPSDTPKEVAIQTGLMTVPFHTQGKKTKEMYDAAKKGYFENKQGRIQAKAPQGVKAIPGAIFGKGYTKEMREYQDNPNIATVIAGKAKLPDLITKNETVNQLSQNILNKNNRDFNRPLSASIVNPDGSVAAQGYSDKAKDAHKAAIDKYGKNSKEATKVLEDWVANGREYNKLTDNLKKNNPTAYDSWIKTKGDDILTPEKWRVLGANKDVFAFEKKRKELEKRDLGRTIDPIYELQEDRANMVLQERSVATGDDMTLRSKLYKEDWYAGAFKDKEQAYFDSFTGQRDMSGKSQRVKDWNAMNEQVFSPEKGVINKYPLVKQYQNELKRFPDYNSQERKDFTKAWYDTHGDAYESQQDGYDRERYALVNKMRKLENQGEISFDVFKGKLEFPSDNIDKYAYGKRKGSGSGSGDSTKATYNIPKVGAPNVDTPNIKVRTLAAPTFKTSTKKLSVNKIPGSYLNRKLG